ncbi:MAG: response regulator, partial [Acidobacteriota bacterium]
LALLDLGLPVMDGYELAQRLRQQPGLEALLLVAVTGYGQVDDKRRSAEAGFDAHLVKPVALDQLQRVLAALVGDRQS